MMEKAGLQNVLESLFRNDAVGCLVGFYYSCGRFKLEGGRKERRRLKTEARGGGGGNCLTTDRSAIEEERRGRGGREEDNADVWFTQNGRNRSIMGTSRKFPKSNELHNHSHS
jgi:hypothetical protein